MDNPACKYLAEKIMAALDYAQNEFDMTPQEAVGVLEILKIIVINKSFSDIKEREGT